MLGVTSLILNVVEKDDYHQLRERRISQNRHGLRVVLLLAGSAVAAGLPVEFAQLQAAAWTFQQDRSPGSAHLLNAARPPAIAIALALASSVETSRAIARQFSARR